MKEIIRLKKITFKYEPPPPFLRILMGGKGRSVVALNDLSLSIEEGEKVSLLGKNGAGKTTLLKILMGLLEATSGVVEVYGKKPSDKEIRKKIGLVQSDDRSFYFRLSVMENLIFFGELWGFEGKGLKDRIYELSEELKIKELLKEPFFSLSSGMRQKVSILRSLISNPQIFLFDEPTKSLDLPSQDDFKNLLKSAFFKDKTLIIATHRIEEAHELSFRSIILNKGCLVYNGKSDMDYYEYLKYMEMNDA